MNRTPSLPPRSPRVYYIVLACALALVLRAGAVGAQIELTVAPAMARGPGDAPVTIVEFSDYQ